MLSLVGVLLVGLSVWSSARVEVSSSGLKAEFERLKTQIQEVASANPVISEEVNKLAENAETGKNSSLS